MNNQANDALCDILREIKDIIKSGQISTEELVTLTDSAVKVAGAIQGGSNDCGWYYADGKKYPGTMSK